MFLDQNPTTLGPPPDIGPPVEVYPWSCNFDAVEGGNITWCYFVQDQYFTLHWKIQTGPSETPNTGPSNPDPGKDVIKIYKLSEL